MTRCARGMALAISLLLLAGLGLPGPTAAQGDIDTAAIDAYITSEMDDSHPRRSAFLAQEVILALVARRDLPDDEAARRAQGVHLHVCARPAIWRLYENQGASQELPQ